MISSDSNSSNGKSSVSRGGSSRTESASIRTNNGTNRSLIDTPSTTSNHLSSSSRRNKREKVKQFIVITIFFIGLIICLTSLVCIILLPTFVTKQISEKLVLKNNSLLLERWSKPNVPMYFKVWVFNVKNAQSIVDQKNIKPQLEEIGPFVFHLRRKKDVISIAGENLYYTERKVYHFAPELSCCSINTTVTVPNIPLAAVVDRALSYNLPLVGRFIPRLINRAIQSLREQLFVRKQVREILFDGYEVELLKMVSRVGSIIGLQPQMSQKFALLKGRNDTWRPEQDGVWAINTGAKDRRQFGRVTSWNSYKQLPFWAAPNCNLINGSDGTLFPPPIKRTEPLFIFNQELCRTVNLVYDRPSDIRSIKALRYVLNPLNFAHTMKGSTRTGVMSLMAPPLTPVTSTMVAPLPSLLGATANLSDASLKPANNNRFARQPATMQFRDQSNPQSISTNGHQLQPSTSLPADVSSHLEDRSSATTTGSLAPSTATRLAQERHIQLAQDAAAASSKRGKMNPNTCFCDRKTTNLNGVNVCEFDGLIDLSKCTKQAQVIFGSMPHFYQGDARLLRQVVGLAPNATKHTTYLDIEPNTGLVLGGKRRVQLNLILKHNNEIDGFENINDMLIPVVWFEESALIPEESAKKFRTLFTQRIKIINITLVSLLLASVVLLIIDTRLIIASQYWRQFKVHSLMSQLAPGTPARSSSSGMKHESYGKAEKFNRSADINRHMSDLHATVNDLDECYKSGLPAPPTETPPNDGYHSQDLHSQQPSPANTATSSASTVSGNGFFISGADGSRSELLSAGSTTMILPPSPIQLQQQQQPATPVASRFTTTGEHTTSLAIGLGPNISSSGNNNNNKWSMQLPRQLIVADEPHQTTQDRSNTGSSSKGSSIVVIGSNNAGSKLQSSKLETDNNGFERQRRRSQTDNDNVTVDRTTSVVSVNTNNSNQV